MLTRSDKRTWKLNVSARFVLLNAKILSKQVGKQGRKIIFKNEKGERKESFCCWGFRFETLRSEVPRDYVFRIFLEKDSIKQDPHRFEAGKPVAEPKLKQYCKILITYIKRFKNA